MLNVLVVNVVLTHSSVAVFKVVPGSTAPPNDKPAVVVPELPISNLAVPRSVFSVQLDPLYISVAVVLAPGVVLPPKNKAEVLVKPDAPASSLPVFKFAIAVQLD